MTISGLLAARLSCSSSHIGSMMLVEGGPSTEANQMLRLRLIRSSRWVGRQRSTSQERSSNCERMSESINKRKKERKGRQMGWSSVRQAIRRQSIPEIVPSALFQESTVATGGLL